MNTHFLRCFLPACFRRFLHLLLLALGLACVLTLSGCAMHMDGMLDPKGFIAYQERRLFFDTLALMLIVVVPVIIMSFAFVFHYRASHRLEDEHSYKPNWSHSYFLETLWWGIPCVIIVILGIMTWIKSHTLDPYRTLSIDNNEPPLLVQAIALPWKWIFIYPAQHIATVNYVEVPVNRQVEYWITADNVPMSAFFIPRLGSQIYAMAGMRTRLHLISNVEGVYDGMNTMFNGEGFSDMHFSVHVVSQAAMNQWVQTVQQSPTQLTTDVYNHLLKPSDGNPPQFFAGASDKLFQQVINVYMNTFGPVHPREKQNEGISS